MASAEPDLRARLEELLAAAKAARENAYAPYSRFTVGAALLVGDDIVTGSNVENASYSVAICAERVAGAHAVATGRRDFRAIAVAGPGDEPLTPCGVCRQFLNEFNPGMVVVSEGASGERFAEPLSALLPEAFGPSNLDAAE
ncbi:MAG: cytidine deaminase [Actinobacteria bacterium]|nr:cytidine deaminase [Actinomycetota bacterium]